MSKFDDLMVKYTADLDALGQKYDAELLRKVAIGLGPSIYNKDAALVAASDKAEMARLKANFLIKKLGMTDNADLDKAMAEVKDHYSVPRKHRPVFYYLLVEKLGKASAYNK